MRDDSAEILFQPFLQESLVNFWQGQGCPLFDVVQQAFPPLTKASPTLKGVLRNGFERLSWRVTRPNHASFRLLTVARRSPCGSTRKLILSRTQSLVLCSKLEMRRSILGHTRQNSTNMHVVATKNLQPHLSNCGRSRQTSGDRHSTQVI